MADRVKTSDLKSRFLHLAQTSVYTVKLQPPPLVSSYLRSNGFNYSGDGEDVELRCKSTQLPATNFQTHDQMNDYQGMREKMAYRRMFTPVQFDFYVDDRYDVVEMFEGWMEYISGQTTNDDSYARGYRMNYPSKYKTNVFISKFEKGVDRERSYQIDYTLVNAFPSATMPMEVSYDSSQILTFSVVMEYTKFTKTRRNV